MKLVRLYESQVETVRKKFNIGKDIDYHILELVCMFNIIGLKTEWSCIGHDGYESVIIVFNKDVKDEDILNVANKIFLDGKYIGEFNKWIRTEKTGYLNETKNEILSNWTFTIPNTYCKWFYGDRRILTNEVVKALYDKIYNKNHEYWWV